MNTNHSLHRSRYLFAILVVLLGCDIVNDDPSAKEISATVYAFAGKPVIINSSSFSGGFDLRAQDEVSGQFGSITPVLDGRYLIYTPGASFAGKQENLTVALNNSGKLNLTVKSLDNGTITGCEAVAGIYDYAAMSAGSEMIIDLLDNDIFCGVRYNGGLIGGVALEGISEEDYLLTLGPGRSATFRFSPGPGFRGKVKVIYNLGINWIEGSGYENKSHEQILANPMKYLEAFTTSMIEIDVHD